ncbi:hypothetical protein THIOKS13330006 [Thiocapsa sp. KS1]|nr:hypothetical protein THIOKS13330006 [Thiocapsa sp. KS1]
MRACCRRGDGAKVPRPRRGQTGTCFLPGVLRRADPKHPRGVCARSILRPRQGAVERLDDVVDPVERGQIAFDFRGEFIIAGLGPATDFRVGHGQPIDRQPADPRFFEQPVQNPLFCRRVLAQRMVAQNVVQIEDVLPAEAVAGLLLEQGAKLLRHHLHQTVGADGAAVPQLEQIGLLDRFVQAVVDLDDMRSRPGLQPFVGWSALGGIADADLEGRERRVIVFGLLNAALDTAIETVTQALHGVAQALFEALPEIHRIEVRAPDGGREVDVLGVARAAVAQGQQHPAFHDHGGLKNGCAGDGGKNGVDGLTERLAVGILLDPFPDVGCLQSFLLSGVVCFFDVER